jgi:hypothetical protein
MTDVAPPELVARVRRRYLEGAPLRTIMAEAQLSQDTVYRCVRGKLDDGSGEPPKPLPERRVGRRLPKVRRKALVGRLWRTAEQQVEQIEEWLTRHGQEPDDRNTRAIATLTKTVRELAAFDEAQAAKRPRVRTKTDPAHDDPVPRDIEEFRRELARRIHALVARRTDRAVDEPK